MPSLNLFGDRRVLIMLLSRLFDFLHTFFYRHSKRLEEQPSAIGITSDEWRFMFVCETVRNFEFHINPDLLVRDCFSMFNIVSCDPRVRPNHDTLTALAGHAMQIMRRRFEVMRRHFVDDDDDDGNARYVPDNVSELATAWKRLKMRVPATVTAMLLGDKIYITSSVRARQLSIFSMLADHVQEPYASVRRCLQDVQMWDASAPDPILHHQRANCSEMAALLLWCTLNSSCCTSRLKGALIVTVHQDDGQLRVFQPCRSCQPILDCLRLDYGPSSLIAAERQYGYLNAFGEMERRRNLALARDIERRRNLASAQQCRALLSLSVRQCPSKPATTRRMSRKLKTGTAASRSCLSQL